MNATSRFDARGPSLGAALAAAVALLYSPPVASQSGAPADPGRSGQHVVEAQCLKCHASGAYGAPRVGDRSAWIPRLTRGVDALVGSAILGRGDMPPRGGQADLTDAELRQAVVYILDPAREEQGTMFAGARPVPSARARGATAAADARFDDTF